MGVCVGVCVGVCIRTTSVWPLQSYIRTASFRLQNSHMNVKVQAIVTLIPLRSKLYPHNSVKHEILQLWSSCTISVEADDNPKQCELTSFSALYKPHHMPLQSSYVTCVHMHTP